MKHKSSHPSSSRLYLALVLALLAAMVLAGCGSGDQAGPAAGSVPSIDVQYGGGGGGGARGGGGGSNLGGGGGGGQARGSNSGLNPGGSALSGGLSGHTPLGAGSFGRGGVQQPGGGLGGPGGAGTTGPGFRGFQTGGRPGQGAGTGSLAGGTPAAGHLRPGSDETPGPGRLAQDRGSEGVAGVGPGIAGLFSGEPLNLAGFGGFGVVTGGPAPLPGQETAPAQVHGWLPAGPGEWQGDIPWPDLPTIYDELDPAIDLQQQAQEAAGQAAEDAQQAAQAAQQAYEQMWADYYDAVDYAAQAYYDTVTGAATVTYDIYAQAVADAYGVAGYVYDNYASYAAYCYAYPWDCYAYAYDAAAGIYTTTQVVNNYYYNYAQGGSGTSPQPTPLPAPPSQVPAGQVPQPSAAAYEALVIFANDQLGLAINPIYAGEVTADVLALLSALPTDVQQAIAAVPVTSAASYWGLMTGGAAMVSVGECSADAPCPLTGQMEVDLSSASLGAYALRVSEAMPAEAETALSLVQLAFPKLSGLDLLPVTGADLPGYAFYGTTTGLGLDANGKPVAVSKGILAGVVPAGDVTVVYAAAGVGGYSVALNPFN